ncbi:hypothetical protein CVU37_06190 [candidate division BRC1 bacterium HGW-BRC1-1]|jgi:DNA-binding MarR family transcriptional regulator|nr:MAG: hypothetical protein CVU37_06190 [candidate division BRC1 bacterium HGW-BRC1-1]
MNPQTSSTVSNPASRDAVVLDAIASLQRLTGLFQVRLDQLAHEAGVTPQQWRVLEEICGEHFMPSMFARECESSPAAVSKILRQLIDKGIVRAGVSEHDGRQRTYTPTAAGRRVMSRLTAAREHAIEAVWSDLPRKELQSFKSFSNDLISRLEAYARAKEQRDNHG